MVSISLALIAKAALRNPQLRTIVSARRYPWKSAQGSKLLENSNKLLGSYDGAVGVKTGNTREAGYCLAAAAQRSRKAYIAVVLNSREKAVWEDARKLLDYGFSESASF